MDGNDSATGFYSIAILSMMLTSDPSCRISMTSVRRVSPLTRSLTDLIHVGIPSRIQRMHKIYAMFHVFVMTFEPSMSRRKADAMAV